VPGQRFRKGHLPAHPERPEDQVRNPVRFSLWTTDTEVVYDICN
jgi:hypothetical protein